MPSHALPCTLLCRHRGPALVCRSWAQLLCTPQLLSSEPLKFSGSGRRLRSFAGWVAHQAAGHVRQLDLTVTAPFEEDDDEDDENQEEAVATAAACAVACCAAGRLEDLELSTSEA